ncbi:UPF0149 family protein [Vibrio salinus]|uniref:UPF0149 family protein n=1 Tax=Vibrio salinus TaxID=2899784 RepID=UPI001E2E0CDD|nr:UPF0149 family protein [Vibrio salinus]MCE0492809.1 UPF0149 family protein [Vibrio salinus]
MKLNGFLSSLDNDDTLLNEAKTLGFVTALAAAPNIISPNEWLACLWGNTEQPPFTSTRQLEEYIGIIIEIWNEARQSILEGAWIWPDGYTLDDDEIVSESTRDFCEGLLQGWQLTHDDWNELMPEGSENGALLGGFLLSISMLFDPETALAALAEHGAEGLEQFKEIYDAVPDMLTGLVLRASEQN